MSKALLEVLHRKVRTPPPIWLMRQAGRYLPEYRAIRAKAQSFLDLCLTPELAAEITVQPIRQFGFDAAILFSDILLIPHALGQRVSFVDGEGPRLGAIASSGDLAKLKKQLEPQCLSAVYETIGKVREKINAGVAILGFCGGPWTVASYMVAGRATPDLEPVRMFAYRDPNAFGALIDLLVDASASHLTDQLKAGADAVQIFDTWAGVLADEGFHRWCIEPTRKIIAKVRDEIPDAKFIGFPRGIGTGLLAYLENVAVDALGLDWTVDLAFARDRIQSRVPVQGNLDPLVLVAGGEALDRALDCILHAFSDAPFIFNLGHGVLPQTPIEHVEHMLRRVRGS